MTLHLPLKEKWYRMIESGEKKEEYREITPYWIKRLINERITDREGVGRQWRIGTSAAQWYAEHVEQLKYDIVNGHATFRDFENVHFTLGYPKCDDESRHMFKRMKTIEIGCGRPEWGAESDKKYFVIKWNERL